MITKVFVLFFFPYLFVLSFVVQNLFSLSDWFPLWQWYVCHKLLWLCAPLSVSRKSKKANVLRSTLIGQALIPSAIPLKQPATQPLEPKVSFCFLSGSGAKGQILKLESGTLDRGRYIVGQWSVKLISSCYNTSLSFLTTFLVLHFGMFFVLFYKSS